MEANDFENTAAFIRVHRGNEGNFKKLYHKLEREIIENNSTEKYVSALREIKEKSATEYQKAKETVGTAWPEFEKFVTDFERAVLNVK